VELLASVAHAKKTLEELIEDRKTISHQLWEVREQQDDTEQPPAKVRTSVAFVSCKFT